MFFPLANDKKAPATPRRLSVGRGMAEAKFAERHGAASSALSTLHEAVVRQGRTVNHSRATPGARPFEKKIVGVTDPRPCDELIDESAIFPGE